MSESWLDSTRNEGAESSFEFSSSHSHVWPCLWAMWWSGWLTWRLTEGVGRRDEGRRAYTWQSSCRGSCQDGKRLRGKKVREFCNLLRRNQRLRAMERRFPRNSRQVGEARELGGTGLSHTQTGIRFHGQSSFGCDSTVRYTSSV
jgi:hypothetical protein